MKLKIISDGTPAGTRVLTEHGDEIEGIQLLSWSVNCMDEGAEATIHLWGVPCEITSMAATILVDDIREEHQLPVDDDGNNVIDVSDLIRARRE